MKNIKEELLKFHEKYNLIFDEQEKLSRRRGKKDYYENENKIIVMSRDLISELNIFKKNLVENNNDVNVNIESIIAEIENIIDGCHKLIENPYKELGGRRNLY